MAFITKAAVKRLIMQAMREGERHNVESIAGAVALVAQLVVILDSRGVISKNALAAALQKKLPRLPPAARGVEVHLATIGLLAMLKGGERQRRPQTRTYH